MFNPIRSAAMALLLGTALLASPAFAESWKVTAALSAAEEVPPNDSTATGTVEGTYDTETKALTWNIAYYGLTGPATAAHFHGPAKPGENAGPVVPIEGDLASPIEGTATLNDEQAQQLKDGLWYFNVHTGNYPDGEIRGQVSATAGAM